MWCISRRLDIPATLALLGATLCWGTVPVMLRYLARPEYVPDGFTSNLARYPLAALIYLPWLLKGARSGQLRGIWLKALIPTAANLVMQTLWAWAPYYLEAGVLAFLIRLCVIWSIIGAFLLFRDERRLAGNPAFWIGTTLALAGFLIMSWQSLLRAGAASPTGIAIIFFCGIFWAAYGVSVRYVMRNLSPLVVFSLISLYTSVGLAALSPLGEPAALLHLPLRETIVLYASAVLGIAVAHGLFYIAIQRIGVAICSLMLMATPLVSVATASLALDEWMTPGQWLGGAALLAGAFLALRVQTTVAEPSTAEAAVPPD